MDEWKGGDKEEGRKVGGGREGRRDDGHPQFLRGGCVPGDEHVRQAVGSSSSSCATGVHRTTVSGT